MKNDGNIILFKARMILKGFFILDENLHLKKYFQVFINCLFMEEWKLGLIDFIL